MTQRTLVLRYNDLVFNPFVLVSHFIKHNSDKIRRKNTNDPWFIMRLLVFCFSSSVQVISIQQHLHFKSSSGSTHTLCKTIPFPGRGNRSQLPAIHVIVPPSNCYSTQSTDLLNYDRPGCFRPMVSVSECDSSIKTHLYLKNQIIPGLHKGMVVILLVTIINS